MEDLKNSKLLENALALGHPKCPSAEVRRSFRCQILKLKWFVGPTKPNIS